jgi:hypothetical protein
MNLIYTSKNFIRTLILASFVILPTTVYADRGVNLAFSIVSIGLVKFFVKCFFNFILQKRCNSL